MTLRPGWYDASALRPRAVVRNDGTPWFVCTHKHGTSKEATQCARDATPALKAIDTTRPLQDSDLPPGWKVYDQTTDRNM
jgi:hypothetical protein